VTRVALQSAPDRVCVAPACSDLAPERMLSGLQWERVLPRFVRDGTEVVILGGSSDSAVAELVIQHGKRVVSSASWINACDGRPLAESLQLLAGCSRLIAIDSSLCHFARVLGIPTVSFWGPTDPMTLLKNSPLAGEQIWYEKIVCSPCIHVAETPPCSGHNVCIEAAVRRFCGDEMESLEKPPLLFPRLDKNAGKQ
jgi:ADP-heptose:LPS heptosyltransferase